MVREPAGWVPSVGTWHIYVCAAVRARIAFYRWYTQCTHEYMHSALTSVCTVHLRVYICTVHIRVQYTQCTHECMHSALTSVCTVHLRVYAQCTHECSIHSALTSAAYTVHSRGQHAQCTHEGSMHSALTRAACTVQSHRLHYTVFRTCAAGVTETRIDGLSELQQ